MFNLNIKGKPYAIIKNLFISSLNHEDGYYIEGNDSKILYLNYESKAAHSAG